MSNKLFVNTFSLYLGLSPIFWFPFIPPAFILFFKFFLFFIISLFTFSYYYLKKSPKFNFPGGGKTIYLLITMFLLLLPYILFGYHSANAFSLVNIFQIIIFLMASIVIIEMKQVHNVIKSSLKIVSLFVFISVVLMFLIPAFPNPFNPALNLLNSGFGGSRTGWGPSIALYIPFILPFFSNITLVLLYLSSQLMTGGRAGFYFSLLLLPFSIYSEKSLKLYCKVSVVVIFGVLALFIHSPDFLSELRVLNSFDFSSKDINEVSSGRVALLEDALLSISNSPFFGQAVHSSFVGEGVHNVFIKNWVYYGFLYLLCSLLLVLYVLIKSFFRVFSVQQNVDKKMCVALFLVLSNGFLLAMIEPSIIFGNFNTFSVWWFCFALTASNQFLLSTEKGFCSA